jgi:phosphopantetheine adenylyltransferase
MLFTSEIIHIGITSDVLLKKKAYAEYLEDYDVRYQRVKDLVNKLNPSV